MAMGIAQYYAQELSVNAVVRSCGLLGIEDSPADSHAIAVCSEIGIELREHRSQGITNELLEWADYIFAMQFHQVMKIRQEHVDVGERLHLLGTFAGIPEIPDPIGGWRFQFRRCRNDIQRALETFMSRLSPRGFQEDS